MVRGITPVFVQKLRRVTKYLLEKFTSRQDRTTHLLNTNYKPCLFIQVGWSVGLVILITTNHRPTEHPQPQNKFRSVINGIMLESSSALRFLTSKQADFKEIFKIASVAPYGKRAQPLSCYFLFYLRHTKRRCSGRKRAYKHHCTVVRRAQNTGAGSPWRLNFVTWRLTFVRPRYGTCLCHPSGA